MGMWQGLGSYAIVTLLALFPVANPIGAIPAFYGMTASDSRPYRMRQAQKTAINVIGVLATFFVGGRFVLSLFGLSLDVLRIAGGLVVAHAAWEMVTARQRMNAAEHQDAKDKEDVSFTPMALPLIAGPGSIGVVIGLAANANQWSNYAGGLIGIGLFGAVLYFCLALGEPLIGKLGPTGLGALNRVFGFFILAIGVQLIAQGVLALLHLSGSR